MKDFPVKHYSASVIARKVFSLKYMFKDLSSGIFLGRQLFKRDIKAMFRQSFLGLAWAFLPPFFTAAIWIFLKSSGAVNISDVGMPYPVYVLAGTIIFQTIAEAMRLPAEVTTKNKPMLIKLNFPRESLLISSFLQICFNFLFKFLALVLVLLFFKTSLGMHSLFFLFALLGSVFVGYSVGVFLIPLQMLYTDFTRALNLFMQVMLYLTPVVYAYPEKGFLLHVVRVNPFTPLVEVPRSLLVNQGASATSYYISLVLISVILFLLSWMVFRLTMPIIIERSGN